MLYRPAILKTVYLMFKTFFNLSIPLTLKVIVSGVFMVWAYPNDFVCIDMTEFFLSLYQNMQIKIFYQYVCSFSCPKTETYMCREIL